MNFPRKHRIFLLILSDFSGFPPAYLQFLKNIFAGLGSILSRMGWFFGITIPKSPTRGYRIPRAKKSHFHRDSVDPVNFASSGFWLITYLTNLSIPTKQNFYTTWKISQNLVKNQFLSKILNSSL